MVQLPKIVRLDPDGPKGVGLSPMTLDRSDFQSDLPAQNVHVYYEDQALGLTVGVWDTTTMQEAFGPYPGDEFIWVLEGQFAILDGCGGITTFAAGDSVVFRNAAPVSWKQEGYLKKFFVTYLDPKAGTPQIDSTDGAVKVLDPGQDLKMTSFAGEPAEREYIGFVNDSGNFKVGVWECHAARFGMEPFSVHEFIRVMEGGARITEENGTVHDIRAGDCIFIPKGTVCQWHIPTYIKTHFASLS